MYITLTPGRSAFLTAHVYHRGDALKGGEAPGDLRTAGLLMMKIKRVVHEVGRP